MTILIADDESAALTAAEELTRELLPQAEIICADNYIKALEAAKKEPIAVALLDIEMPGMNGMELAKQLKEINSRTNIIFVTAFSRYALDAYSLYPSGYLLKPIEKAALEDNLRNLRTPVHYQKGKLRIQCFGKFEVFHEGNIVVFEREKAKEILAYLIDMRGASVNTGELCAALWDAAEEDTEKRHYLRNLIMYMKKSLKECGASDVLICRRNSFAVDVSRVECDYYKFLEKDVSAVNSYNGEYMKQYSWAEFTLGYLEKNKK